MGRTKDLDPFFWRHHKQDYMVIGTCLDRQIQRGCLGVAEGKTRRMRGSNWIFQFNILKVGQFWVMTIARVAEERWRTKIAQMSKPKDLRAQMLTGTSLRTLKSSRMMAGKKTVRC